MNKIEKFIKDNNLDFSGSGSDLNGNCVILAGYACYLELYWKELDIMMCNIFTTNYSSCQFQDELYKVFDYANDQLYGYWWKKEEAKKMYKF